MHVGFLYIVLTKVLLGPEQTRVSRKSKAPSWLVSSVVNCMCGSCQLMCCGNCWLCFACCMVKVSPINLSHKWEVWSRADGFDFKLFYQHVGN